MSDLLGRIKRLERKILPRYRACYARWQRLLARRERATALQQRDPSTWNGDEQHFMTHWQFFLDRHPKLAQRLQNLPPAQNHATAPAKAEAEPNQGKREEARGKSSGANQPKIENPKSKIDAEGIEDPALNRSDSAKSAHLAANRSPLPPNLGGRGGGAGTGEGAGSYLEYFVSRGAKRVPSVKLDVGGDQPIHSNVVLPNLDED